MHSGPRCAWLVLRLSTQVGLASDGNAADTVSDAKDERCTSVIVHSAGDSDGALSVEIDGSVIDVKMPSLPAPSSLLRVSTATQGGACKDVILQAYFFAADTPSRHASPIDVPHPCQATIIGLTSSQRGLQIVQKKPRSFVVQYMGTNYEVSVRAAVLHRGARACLRRRSSSRRRVPQCAQLSLTHSCVHQVDSPLQARLQEHMPVKTAVDTSKMLLSPMPGKLVSIAVKVGDKVAPGQELVVVEAMKMQNVLKSHVGAVVRAGTQAIPMHASSVHTNHLLRTRSLVGAHAVEE